MPTPAANSAIVAQAFRLMELAPVSSLADDSEKAFAAAEQYPVALDMCLEACDWSFASVEVALPALAALPADNAANPGLPHSFAMPGLCVALREVGDETTRWRRDRDLLRADCPAPLRVRYTARIENEARLPATFRTAVAWRLAALLAPQWVSVAEKVAALERGADTTLRAAMKQDAQQAGLMRYDGRPDQPDWVAEARR